MRRVKQIKAKNTLLGFSSSGRTRKFQLSTFTQKSLEYQRYTHRHMYRDTCICGGKKKAQSTEHTHSILATHPELDGTGLECLSYATLHFNSRTGQRVFMIRPWSLAEEKQVCIETASRCQSTLTVCLF